MIPATTLALREEGERGELGEQGESWGNVVLVIQGQLAQCSLLIAWNELNPTHTHLL